MSSPEVLQALARYEVQDPEKIFAALNDPDCGVAYVPLDNGANPQGLVDRYAELIREGNIAKESFYYQYENYPEYIGFNKFNGDVSLGRSIADEFRLVFSGIRDKVSRAIIPASGGKLKKLNACTGALRVDVVARPNNDKGHTDNNGLTALLGASAYGHVVELPNEGWRPVEKLDEGHVLLTRQREWFLAGSQLAVLADGVRHYVNWEPSEEEDFRVVGLDFIGKWYGM